ISDYRAQHRGGKGVITLKTNAKVGKMIALKEVVEKDDLMLISAGGLMIRMPINKISTYSRNTQGVKLINLKGEDHLSAVAYVAEENEEDEE
ncbi:MAG: DNA gyrase C-terminal beta-propeller domain-containing protein, partial [Candidatus Marinimicrobia bacterium]|nr:DNA gyrase C-terminal beta-propeller domain-containing protein [Candidatus Neomarinimicrobiota bacterium]